MLNLIIIPTGTQSCYFHHHGQTIHLTENVSLMTLFKILCILQLRGNQKDFNFKLHHHLSKFEVAVIVNLKHIFELFGLYTTCFLIQKLLELIRLSSAGYFWRKSQNKKGGKFELRSQLCYYNCITYNNSYATS